MELKNANDNNKNLKSAKIINKLEKDITKRKVIAKTLGKVLAGEIFIYLVAYVIPALISPGVATAYAGAFSSIAALFTNTFAQIFAAKASIAAL
ncbi:MAG: hypothetical protein COC15_02950 [Legionellales bacterium]|nr:MAG: hypothetical protein COC15_02950 [Legionellales bacterium]